MSNLPERTPIGLKHLPGAVVLKNELRKNICTY